MDQIIDFLDILAKPERITAIIHEELEEIKTNFGDERRSEINPFGGDIADEDLIPPREMVVTLTHGGYIKTQPTTDYQAQRRGGRGKQAAATKDEDFIETLFVANTHDYLMCFTNFGKCHWIKVYKLPEGGRNSRGRPINNVIQLDEGEKVSAIMAVREFPEDEYVFFATAQGMVKKVQLSAFKNVRAQGIKAIALKDGDSLVGVAKTSGTSDIMLFSNLGKAIRFNEYYERNGEADDLENEDSDGLDMETPEAENDDDTAETPVLKGNGVRPSGRGSGGLRGMRLPAGGRIVSLITFAPESEQNQSLQVLTATANGYGKRTPIADYSRKGKGGQGNIAINTGERNGELVAATLVADTDDLMLITSGGVLIRTKVGQIRETGRAAAGVRLINLDEGETLVSLERVAEADDETEAVETAAETVETGTSNPEASGQ
ncbi:DNA gyrase C-terminal beta-propeller domain-containing protein, partial [Neisseria sp.]|uniref:DNA gyrase C-terminal beta-propeller domain-containing protein n=1 Tax=Neisseria sp. TaxID=192066 RepID=UPI0035A0B31A